MIYKLRHCFGNLIHLETISYSSRISSICSQNIYSKQTNSHDNVAGIYQEATTPAPILFFYGNQEFSANELFVAMRLGNDLSLISDFPFRFVEAMGPLNNAQAVMDTRTSRGAGICIRLIELMTLMRRTSCTDARDKVFAPLGHATDIDTSLLTIDYTKSLRDVYIDLVRFMIADHSRSSLAFLSHIYAPAEDASSEIWMVRPSPPLPSVSRNILRVNA